MSAPRCTTCGSEVGERLICPNCGTLVAAERRLAKMSATVHAYASHKLEGLPRRITAAHFLWACALMPVFVLPPMVSLAFAILSMRQKSEAPGHVNAEWLGIISLLNIGLSLLLLYKLHFSPQEIAAYFGDVFHSLLRSIFQFVPFPKQQGGGRIIPI